MEPTDFEYGERQYTAEDPAGHQWTFSETLSDVAPEEWGGISAGGARGAINGVHALVFSKDAPALRGFFRDALGFASVDAGDGWLIFALPPAELGIHPADETRHEIYLMCDDIAAASAALRAKGIEVSEPAQAGFGVVVSINTPDGAELSLYQPHHPTAI